MDRIKEERLSILDEQPKVIDDIFNNYFDQSQVLSVSKEQKNNWIILDHSKFQLCREDQHSGRIQYSLRAKHRYPSLDVMFNYCNGTYAETLVLTNSLNKNNKDDLNYYEERALAYIEHISRYCADANAMRDLAGFDAFIDAYDAAQRFQITSID